MIRSNTTTPPLKTAAFTAANTAQDVFRVEQSEQDIQAESSASPVCAYNEWDPLEVATGL